MQNSECKDGTKKWFLLDMRNHKLTSCLSLHVVSCPQTKGDKKALKHNLFCVFQPHWTGCFWVLFLFMIWEKARSGNHSHTDGHRVRLSGPTHSPLSLTNNKNFNQLTSFHLPLLFFKLFQRHISALYLPPTPTWFPLPYQFTHTYTNTHTHTHTLPMHLWDLHAVWSHNPALWPAAYS